jgi:hypothetical protein
MLPDTPVMVLVGASPCTALFGARGSRSPAYGIFFLHAASRPRGFTPHGCNLLGVAAFTGWASHVLSRGDHIFGHRCASKGPWRRYCLV